MCPKCSRKFDTKASFAKHIEWKCNECLKEFCQKEAWIQHMESAHTSNSSFSKVSHEIIKPRCQNCSGIFLSVQSLDEHFQHFCVRCSEKFCQKEAWIEHMNSAHPSTSSFLKVNHEITKSRCQTCSGIFFGAKSLNGHFQHVCPICSEKFCQKKAWIEHLELAHSKKSEMVSDRPYLELDNNSGLLNVNNQKPELKCQSCLGSFFDRGTLAKHFKHFCSLCWGKFCQEEEWIQHLSSVHPYYKKTESKCQSCSEIFDCATTLADHFEHSCDRCSEKFCQKEALIEHFLLAHSQKSDVVKLQFKQPTPTKVNNEKEKEETFYKCPRCSLVFSHRTRLKEHFDSDHSPFRMGIILPKPNILEKEREKVNFKCAYCPKAFSSKSNLAEHFNLKHSNKSDEESVIYKCAKCTEVFRSENELADHFGSEHSSREKTSEMYQKFSNLYCKKCSEVFNDESELADHLIGEHSSEEKTVNLTCEKTVNLTCEKCSGIEFTTKEDLLQHMLTNHIKTVSRGELENNDEKTTRRQKLQAYEAAQYYVAQPEKSPSIEIDPSTIIQIDDKIYTEITPDQTPAHAPGSKWNQHIETARDHYNQEQGNLFRGIANCLGAARTVV